MTSRPPVSATQQRIGLDEAIRQSKSDSAFGLVAQLDAKLRQCGRCMVDVQGDGNCYFHALTETLAVEAAENAKRAHTELRSALVDTLEQFWDCRLDADEAPGERAFMFSSVSGT